MSEDGIAKASQRALEGNLATGSEKLASQRKLFVRERLALLLDEGSLVEDALLANANAPITLNGVPDPVTGALPTLDGQNAVTATNTAWDSIFFNFEGVVLVTPGHHPYGYIPSWITIENLHIQNCFKFKTA